METQFILAERMEFVFLPAIILISVFIVGGLLLIVLALWIWSKLWGKGSVQIDAECLDINVHTAKTGTGINRTYFRNAKKPVYRYYYNGQEYISSPLLSSNRQGYQPETGYCKIWIHPRHPNKVYSYERKAVALILIFIGTLWMVLGIAAIFVVKAFFVAL